MSTRKARLREKEYSYKEVTTFSPLLDCWNNSSSFLRSSCTRNKFSTNKQHYIE